LAGTGCDRWNKQIGNLADFYDRSFKSDYFVQMAFQQPRLLTANDYKTLWLATLGGSLEFYDFIIFVFFANIIGELFFPPESPAWVRQFQTFGIFAAGYLARPLGGIVMAHAGDLRGRRQMFTLGIFLMGLSTFGVGLLPTYANMGTWAPILLLLFRVLQGVAIGGEVPGAWVFVSEHVPTSRVGLACGILTGGLTGGILLGSLVATGLNLLMSPVQCAAYGWRIPFLLGGAFGLLSVYLRRLLSETPVFEDLKARRALAAEMPLRTAHYTGVLCLVGFGIGIFLNFHNRRLISEVIPSLEFNRKIAP
jgi:MFS family permease